MGVFRRKRARAVEGGRTGHECPSCGGPTVIDYVDLVEKVSSRHCVRCSRMWWTSEQGAEVASR